MDIFNVSNGVAGVSVKRYSLSTQVLYRWFLCIAQFTFNIFQRVCVCLFVYCVGPPGALTLNSFFFFQSRSGGPCYQCSAFDTRYIPPLNPQFDCCLYIFLCNIFLLALLFMQYLFFFSSDVSTSSVNDFFFVVRG